MANLPLDSCTVPVN